jgi:hypothetical protein
MRSDNLVSKADRGGRSPPYEDSPMPISRVAVIFDNSQRPETTGTYCLRALNGLVEVKHYPPGQLDQIPREGVDLYLCIDDGLRYPIPAGLHPTAYWAIDTHLYPAWHVEKAQVDGNRDAISIDAKGGSCRLPKCGTRGMMTFPRVSSPSAKLIASLRQEAREGRIISKMSDLSLRPCG